MRYIFASIFENKFLWRTLLCVCGAALYFTLPWETPCVVWIIGLVCAIAAFFARQNHIVRNIAVFAFGFFYAAAYAHIIATPQITRNLRDITFSGRVAAIDYTAEKTRLIIDTGDINPDSYGRMTVRVNLGDDMTTPNVGDAVRVTGTLFRAHGEYAPATFDFARWSYFNGIGATGYLTDINVTAHGTGNTATHLRDTIHRTTNSFLVDGLVLGFGRAIPDADRAIWTTNGIGHVWSISGFHMTLVAGWLFAIFYFILRGVPFITRRVPARIPATILAWVGLACYMTISGAGVATIRAFLMITLIFAAFILGRRAVSLRNVALAMIAVFLINPHYVMQAGFQLSFAAVFGLVYFFGGEFKTPENKILKIIYATIMTSVIATIFTAPFVAAHFQLMPVYGLIGNLVLLPIFSFLIMPCVMIGTFTSMLGWSGPIIAAHWIYNGTLQIAGALANLPMANIVMPHVSNPALMIFVFGFAILVFGKQNHTEKIISHYTNEIICAVFFIIGMTSVYITPRPVVYATHDHELIAFRTPDDTLQFNKSRASNHYFAFGTWKQFNGDAPDTPTIRMKCDRGVCRYQNKNFEFVYIQKFVPLAREINNLCRATDVDYIASYFDVYAPNCNARILRGPFVIYSSGRVQPILHRRRWHNPHQ